MIIFIYWDAYVFMQPFSSKIPNFEPKITIIKTKTIFENKIMSGDTKKYQNIGLGK